VVIDFIDMKDKKHQKEVESALKQSLKKDKARVTVGHLSKFGLLELSRQRLRPTAEASAYMPCPTCQGRGRLKTVPVLSLSLLRQISTQVVQSQLQEVRAVVPVEVSNFLLNQKRKEILALEEQYNLRILFTTKAGLTQEEIQLEFVKRETEEPKREAKPAAQREARPEAQPEEKPEAAPEAKPEARGTRRGTRRGPRRGPRRPREAKVEETPEVQAEVTPEVQPEAPAEVKPEARRPRRASRRGPSRSKRAPKSEATEAPESQREREPEQAQTPFKPAPPAEPE
jgi:ribonuclease E